MGHTGTTISLRDLALALADLGVKDPATIRMIAGMLGFQVALAEDAPVPKPVDRPELPRPDAPLRLRDERKTRVTQPDPRAIPINVEHLPGGKEEWIEDVEPFPPQEGEVSVEPPPLEPLFKPQWSRGILSAAVATRDDESELDVGRVAEMIAKREVIARLPTVISRTLRRGAQLLIDRSRVMMPFARDQAWLAREIRRVVGESHVEVLRFAGNPLRGAGVGARPWPRYSPPLPGTPVVLLTDIGICRAAAAADWADVAEWAEFAEGVRRAGCPLITLVPYGPARWPAALRQSMTLIQWDRSTTAATVSRVLSHTRA